MTTYRSDLASRLAPEPSTGRRSTGLVAVATACTVWGSVGLLVRQLDLEAVSIAGFRLAFASAGVLCSACCGAAPSGALRGGSGGAWRCSGC